MITLKELARTDKVVVFEIDYNGVDPISVGGCSNISGLTINGQHMVSVKDYDTLKDAVDKYNALHPDTPDEVEVEIVPNATYGRGWSYKIRGSEQSYVNKGYQIAGFKFEGSEGKHNYWFGYQDRDGDVRPTDMSEFMELKLVYARSVILRKQEVGK